MLKDRWPTALAIGPWALTLGGGEADDVVGGFGEALLLLPLPYLIIAKFLRRGLSWPVLVLGLTATVVLRGWSPCLSGDPTLVGGARTDRGAS